MPKSKKGMRVVQCSGRVKLGTYKGDRCRRTALLPVDDHNNTVGYWCKGHKNQRGAGR